MKKKSFVYLMILSVTALLLSCEEEKNGTGPVQKIEDVDGFVAAVCERAANCPGIAATQQDIDEYVAGISTLFSAPQITEMERFQTYTKSRQDCILDCIEDSICTRFGDSLSAMSDSDVIETFRACEFACP